MQAPLPLLLWRGQRRTDGVVERALFLFEPSGEQLCIAAVYVEEHVSKRIAYIQMVESTCMHVILVFLFSFRHALMPTLLPQVW
jgi:hypothetical protein